MHTISFFYVRIDGRDDSAGVQLWLDHTFTALFSKSGVTCYLSEVIVMEWPDLDRSISPAANDLNL